MKAEPRFLSVKKLLVFGSEGAGKTTLTSVLEDKCFKEEKSTSEGK